MNESKDNLYDLGDAVALSMRLTGIATQTPSEDKSPYIRFTAGTAGIAVPSPEVSRAAHRTAAPPSEAQPSLPAAPFQTWKTMMKWCLEISKAKCGFLMDSQGFILMQEGVDLPEDEFEGIGAEMGTMFRQLNQMEIDGGDLQMVDLTYQNRTMLAIRVKDKVDDFFTIGIVGSEGIHSWPKKVIYQQLVKSIPQLIL